MDWQHGWVRGLLKHTCHRTICIANIVSRDTNWRP